MRIVKIAYTTDQNRKKIDDQERDIRQIRADIRSLERDIKKLSNQIDDLNIGARRFWQQKTVFTSMERKLERFEKLEKEWDKFKQEMESDIKRLIEKKTRASIQ